MSILNPTRTIPWNQLIKLMPKRKNHMVAHMGKTLSVFLESEGAQLALVHTRPRDSIILITILVHHELVVLVPFFLETLSIYPNTPA